MRFFIIITALLLNAGSLLAQTDSITFKRVEWETKRVAPGVRLKQAWFRNKSLFKSNQLISVLQINQHSKNKISIAYETKLKRKTSDFGSESQALAALNGTFFDVKNGGSVDFIRSNGQIINENRLGKNNIREQREQAALVIKDGLLHIAGWDGSADWEHKLDGQDIMLTGPLLLQDDKLAKLDSNSFNKTRNPRSAIAVTRHNQVLMITVDGRDANSAGVTIFELRTILRWLGCKEGANLDGGGSTTLWVKGPGVVNYPSDSRQWTHNGQRKVANAVLVKRG
jgi:exopolysaccharide biosynthesis protein